MRKKLAILLVLVMAFSLLAGCGGGKTVSTDDGKVTYEEGKATFEDKDGSKAEVNVADEEGEGVALPEGYPEDLLPIVEDSKIQMGNKMEENGKVSYMISYTCSKSAKDVWEFYKDAMKDATDLSTTQVNNIYTANGNKGDQQLTVWISQEEKETSVSLGINPK